jgi:hypothetical protein
MKHPWVLLAALLAWTILAIMAAYLVVVVIQSLSEAWT